MAIKKTRPHFRNHFVLATVIAFLACTDQIFQLIAATFRYRQYMVSRSAMSPTPLACPLIPVQHHQSNFFPLTAV
jgi:hypothetical protein